MGTLQFALNLSANLNILASECNDIHLKIIHHNFYIIPFFHVITVNTFLQSTVRTTWNIHCILFEVK
jgi:hypothetical protein